MIINLVTHYVPELIVPNMYFNANYGITNEEIISKSGIKQRRRVPPGENSNSMAIEAVKKALPKLPFPINEIVRLGDFGSSSVSLSGDDAEKEDEFNSTFIKDISLNFRPGKVVQKVPDSMNYKKYSE